MAVFDTSLLREKFVLTETAAGAGEAPVVALSNRMVVSFANEDGYERETFVIRTQNMHSCVRFAAAIGREIAERGPITYRVADFQWEYLWNDVIKGYERDWNPNIWCALYMNGRLMYAQGEHHPFLDVIEQCAAHYKGDYNDSLPFAEQAFQQAGRHVNIAYDANVALLIKAAPDEAKCGIVLRSASRKTTFSFKALRRTEGKKEPLRVPTVLSVCAAYLEGIQLTFQVGTLNYKYRAAMFEKYSDDYRHRERVTTRLGNLNRATLQFDKDFLVTYRPEQPDFQRYVKDAEAMAARIYAPEDEAGEESASGTGDGEGKDALGGRESAGTA